MKQYIQKLSKLSLSRSWDLILKPWKIPVVLTAPPPLSSLKAISSLFPDISIESIENYQLQLTQNNKLFSELNKKMLKKRHREIIYEESNKFLYMAIRLLKPRIVFETGVFDGQSSAIILQALNDNNNGTLISIDLPASETIKGSTHHMRDTSLPQNCQPGWIIPDYLKERHHLVLGNSKELLPKLFKKYPTIDVFFHDSLHTFEHQYFEYNAAWPHLSKGGLLLSDDIFWSPAFYRFCKEKRKRYIRLSFFGAIKKDE
ncbi:class I SAM-dependent methyltransferase [Candidatus Omnitrophota bacterium]